MNITIDGKKISASQSDKNIVVVADKNGIGIPAPCYRNKAKYGCCKACVVEINNQQKYACAVQPEEGMNIIVKRKDLQKFRKERLQKYQENRNNNTQCGCESDSSSSCC